MNQKGNFTVSFLGLLTAGLLSGCNSTGLGSQSVSVTSNGSSLTSLAAGDLNKSLLPGAVAEVLALRAKVGDDKRLTNDKIAGLSSASLRLSDVDGNDVAYLVLAGPGVNGNFWTSLDRLDEKTAQENGTYNSLVGTQPQSQGVHWVENGVKELKKIGVNLSKLGGEAAVDRLVVINHVALGAKLKTGKLINLSDLSEISAQDVQSFREDDGKLKNNLTNPSKLAELNADWAILDKTLKALRDSGAFEQSAFSAKEFNALGESPDSKLNYAKFALLLGQTKATPPALSGQSVLKGQSETQSVNCVLFFCAYQYNSSMPESVKNYYSGGYAQKPIDYNNVPDSDLYVALEFNAVTSPGVYSPTTQGCGASALISLMDFHWRGNGVTWFNMAKPPIITAAPLYTKLNPSGPYTRPYIPLTPGNIQWTVANNPVMKMGKKNASNTSLAMDYVGTRASGGIGTVVTSQMNGGVYNFLQNQKSTYNLGPGANFVAQMYYADGTGPVSSGTGAGIIRDIMGGYNYPFIAMYPVGTFGGHVSLATDYQVYYPSGGQAIQIWIKDVDFPTVLRRVDNAFSFGFFGYR